MESDPLGCKTLQNLFRRVLIPLGIRPNRASNTSESDSASYEASWASDPVGCQTSLDAEETFPEFFIRERGFCSDMDSHKTAPEESAARNRVFLR